MRSQNINYRLTLGCLKVKTVEYVFLHKTLAKPAVWPGEWPVKAAFLLADGSWFYLELQVLASVIPLKQDAALSSALVEALQGRLVLLHLLHHLWAQIHHRLVVADGQDQHVARSQAALRHRQVTLQRGARALSVSGRRWLWRDARCDTHVCPDADDQVFLHLRAGQTEPAGARRLSCAQSKIWNKSTFMSKSQIWKHKHTGHTCHVTHGACGAVWAAPGDARLHRDAAVGPALRPRMVSSCRVLHPASCPGRRRTDVPAPKQEVQLAERSDLMLCVLSLWRTTVLLLPPRLLCWNSSSVCWGLQKSRRAFRSHPAAASPALTGP